MTTLAERTARALWPAFLLLCAAGCGPAPGHDLSPGGEATQTTTEAIYLGAQASTSDQLASGVVRISITYSDGSPAGCSGVLLTDRWVLTAGHCFCAAQVGNPSSVRLSVYGDLAAKGDTATGALVTTTAASIIKHKTTDAALVNLTTTLPFIVPPLVYTGDGSDLPGQSATTWGYGAHALTQGGLADLSTVGDALYSMAESISFNTTSGSGSSYGCGPDPQEPLLASTGPNAQGNLGSDLTGPRPRILDGDSGGPMFLNGDQTTRVLAGIVQGPMHDQANTGIVYDHFVGLWTIRDWIRQNVPDAPFDTNCTAPVPSSAGAKSATIAEAPSGLPVIAAVQPDNTIGFWGVTLAPVYLGTVPGTSSNTTDPPGLGTEAYAKSGQPLNLGLAYRDRASGRLKYTRWSPDIGWLGTPLDTGFVTSAGPAMAKGGIIAFLDANNRMSVTWYDPNSNAFASPPLMLPSNAPAADPTKRISAIFEPSLGIAGVGYRTTTNAWVDALGSWTCPTYFCGFDNPFPNTFSGAMLAYGNGQRISLVASLLAVPGIYVVQNRVQAYGTSYPWDLNRVFYADPQPGAAQIGNNLFTVSSYIDNSLMLARADNCFANHW